MQTNLTSNKIKIHKSMALLSQQSDPTRTLTLRRLLVHQFHSRFNYISELVNTSIVKNNCFGHLAKTKVDAAYIGYPSKRSSYQQNTFPIPSRDFEFSTNQGKVDGFMSWFRRLVESTIFSMDNFEYLKGIEHPTWIKPYIDNAYKRGILWGRYNIRRNSRLMASLGLTKESIPVDAGSISAAVYSSANADRAAILYTRAYTDLKAITQYMDAEISRILSEGVMLGINPRELATKISDRIFAIGSHRATILARTEIIRAHHLASIQTYRDYGVQGVSVKAEWKTAGDSRVCELCSPLEGKIFTLNEIEGKIPVHPQCRCAALPILVKEEDDKG